MSATKNNDDFKLKIDELLNSFPDYLVVYNPNNEKILFVNDSFFDVLQADRKSLINGDLSLINYYLRINIFDERFKVFKSPIIDHSLTTEIKDIEYNGIQAKIIYFRPTPMAIEDRFKDGIIARGVSMVKAFTLSYVTVFSIDLESDHFFVVNTDVKKDKSMHYDGVASKALVTLINSLCVVDGKKDVKQFINLKTLKDRLRTTQKINIEFYTKKNGWTRIGFIVTERNENNEPVNVLFTLRIVDTEKKKTIELQDTVSEALKSAKSAQEAKTNFLTKIGDDIKNPLNSIIGMASVAKAKIDDRKSIEDSLDKIVDSSKQLVSMFTEVLDMTNIETGNIVFSKENIDIPDLLTSLININKNDILMRKHNITIRTQHLIHEEILGDRLRIQQIFNNILKNAIRYSKNEGKIVITVNEKKMIENRYGEFEFIIEDNGFGMDSTFIPHVFEPFVRGIEEENDNVDGAGLGLSIANSYVEAMGGNISIESVKGKGTKVFVNLKLEVVEDDEEYSKPLFGKKILFLSNNKKQVQNDSAIVKELGASVVSANDSEEAYKEIMKAEYFKKPFDFLICSYMTSNMKGLEELKILKEKKGISLPQIIISHYDIYTIEDETHALGFKNLIKEPLSKKRLVKSFKEIYGESAIIHGVQNIRKDKEMKGKKVLVVEDNEICSTLVCEVLDRRGIECFKAIDGLEALKMIQESDNFYYDLVIMDIQMPIMNGYQASMAIRALDREDTKIIPIVALSNSSFAEDIASSLMSGMNEHISKPLNYGSLYLTLSKWFVGEYAHRKNLEHRAEIDEFTNTFNKTATFNKVDSFLSNDIVPLSAMLILDLDGFKIINDSHGHSIGDEIIKQTSDLIKDCFKDKDIIGRFGGDEFIIFMKDIQNEEVAYRHAEQVRNCIEKAFKGKFAHNLTCSIGIAYVNEPTSINVLFVKADNALYEAKRNGKNQVVIAK